MKRWVYWILLLALFVNGCIEPPAPNPTVSNPTVPTPPAPNSTVIGRPTRSATQEVALELLGHIGGPSMSVAVQGDHAFVGLSLELVVLDIADRTEPQWVASLALPANEVVVTGPYAYVAGRDGFTIVDIREPAQPTVVGNVALSATASTLALAAEHAYVTIYGDLYTIDIVNPTEPTVRGVIRLAPRITGVAVADKTLYVVSDAGFHHFEITDPAKPRLIELFPHNELRYGPIIADGYVYFGGQSALWKQALATPAARIMLTPDTLLDSPLDLAVQDGIAYLASGFQGIHFYMLQPLGGLLIFALTVP